MTRAGLTEAQEELRELPSTHHFGEQAVRPVPLPFSKQGALLAVAKASVPSLPPHPETSLRNVQAPRAPAEGGLNLPSVW